MYENWVEIGKEECIALVKEKSILLEIGATYVGNRRIFRWFPKCAIIHKVNKKTGESTILVAPWVLERDNLWKVLNEYEISQCLPEHTFIPGEPLEEEDCSYYMYE